MVRSIVAKIKKWKMYLWTNFFIFCFILIQYSQSFRFREKFFFLFRFINFWFDFPTPRYVITLWYEYCLNFEFHLVYLVKLNMSLKVLCSMKNRENCRKFSMKMNSFNLVWDFNCSNGKSMIVERRKMQLVWY